MSIDVSGFDTNITYLNIDTIGLADREDTPCVAKIEYPSPLLGRVDGYICSVNRFSIPTHTLHLNDRMKSAIILYTSDKALHTEDNNKHEFVPLDVEAYRQSAPKYAFNEKQGKYLEVEHPQELMDLDLPSLHADDDDYLDWRGVIREDMKNDNVAFFNNRDDNDEFHFTFDYSQCHTLYEVSELLEGWCEKVTAKIRNQGKYTPIAANIGAPAHLMLTDHVPGAPKLYNRDGQQLSNAGYASFVLRIYIAPDYTLRVLCSAPDYIGCFFNKGFRNVFKLPRFLDYDIHTLHNVSPNNFAHAVLPKSSTEFVFDDTLSQEKHIEQQIRIAVPFTPRLSFQDTYHRVRGFTLTSDLPSVGEMSISNAYYRILSNFKYTPSTGTIESFASKKNFLGTDSNFISEAPPGDVEYFAANGTTGRLILLRGAYPLYRLTVQVMTDVILQNPYEYMQDGYIKFDKTIQHAMPSREVLTLAPNARFTCKLAFISRQKMKHIHPDGSH